MRIYIILMLLACVSGHLTAQESAPPAKEYYPRAYVTSLNMTPLITQLIPFNRADPKLTGPIQARFRFYRKGNNAFRFGFGVNVVSVDDITNDNYIHLQLGWEKRKNITDRWSYYKGIEVFATIGPNNVPGRNTNAQDTPGIGPGFIMGMEYAIAPRITLSTEAELLMPLLNDNGINIELIPPVAIFLNYYIR